MNTEIRADIRGRIVEEGQRALAERSLRMRLAGAAVRRDFADAFVAWVTRGGSGKADFARHCRECGINPALVFLLVGIAWDILWWWWTRRDGELGPQAPLVGPHQGVPWEDER